MTIWPDLTNLTPLGDLSLAIDLHKTFRNDRHPDGPWTHLGTGSTRSTYFHEDEPRLAYKVCRYKEQMEYQLYEVGGIAHFSRVAQVAAFVPRAWMWRVEENAVVVVMERMKSYESMRSQQDPDRNKFRVMENALNQQGIRDVGYSNTGWSGEQIKLLDWGSSGTAWRPEREREAKAIQVPDVSPPPPAMRRKRPPRKVATKAGRVRDPKGRFAKEPVTVPAAAVMDGLMLPDMKINMQAPKQGLQTVSMSFPITIPPEMAAQLANFHRGYH